MSISALPFDPAELTVDDAKAALSGVHADDPTTPLVLSALSRLPNGVVAAEQLMAGTAEASDDLAFALAFVLSTGSADPAPLRTLRSSADPSTRALAACGGIVRGDETAFPDVIALLLVDAPLRGSHWLTPVWAVAAATLVAATAHPEFGPARTASPAQRAWSHEAWTTWWGTAGPRLRHDASTGDWTEDAGPA
jgi:hypothetical protein